jgi:hypothetical protein
MLRHEQPTEYVSTFLQWAGSVSPDVSPAGKARLYYDPAAGRLKLSVNGAAYAYMAPAQLSELADFASNILTVPGGLTVSLPAGGATGVRVQDSNGALLFGLEGDGDLRTSRSEAYSTPGTVGRRWPIYDAAGALAGYVPLYPAANLARATAGATAMFNVLDYGAVGDNLTDDTAAIQAALTAADTAGGGTVYFPKATYKVATSVSLTTGDPITLLGEPGAVIDGSSSTASQLITLSGSRENSALLSANVSAGARTFTSSLSGIQPKEILFLSTSEYFFSNPGDTTALFVPTQTDSYKGEFVEVESISGSTFTLTSPLFDSYTATQTKAYRMSIPRIQVIGLTILRASNHMGLVIQNARDIRVQDCRITGARNYAIYLLYCYGGIVQNNSVTDAWYVGTGTSYGLMVGSCQNLLVTGNRFYECRHGITHGAFEPFRNISVIGNVFDSARTPGQAALDYHYNGEYCLAAHNVVRNGISASCRNLQLIGNLISCDTQAGIYLQPQIGSSYLDVIGNVIAATDAAGSQVGILVAPFNPSLVLESVRIQGNTIRNVGTGIGAQPYQSSAVGASITSLALIENDVHAGTGNAIFVQDAGLGIAFTVDRMTIHGGRYLSNGAAGFRMQSVTSNSVEVSGARFETGTAGERPIVANGMGDAAFTSCELRGPAGLGLYCTFGATGHVRVVANRLANFSANGGISLSAGTYTLAENLTSGVSGTPSLTGKAFETNRGATSVADGGTITHNLRTTPTVVRVTPSVAGEFASVTAIGATTFTVALKTHTGAAGTTQTVYWQADV